MTGSENLKKAISYELALAESEKSAGVAKANEPNLALSVARYAAVMHPVAALVVGAVAAVAASPYFIAKAGINSIKESWRNAAYFETYLDDGTKCNLALGLIPHIDGDNIGSIQVNVLGGLSHLMGSFLFPALSERLASLNRLLETDGSNEEGLRRKSIYEQAVVELGTIHGLVEAEFEVKKKQASDEELIFNNNIKIEIAELDEKIADNLSTVKVAEQSLQKIQGEYSSGLITRSQYELKCDTERQQLDLVLRAAEEANRPLIDRKKKLAKIKFFPWESLETHSARLVPKLMDTRLNRFVNEYEPQEISLNKKLAVIALVILAIFGATILFQSP